MKEQGLLEQILDKCTTIETVQRGLPNEDRVRVIIREEQLNCPAFKGFGNVANRAAKNTGFIEGLRESGTIRRSLAPAARKIGLDKIPLIIWKIVLVIAIGILGKFGWDGSADLLRLLTSPTPVSASEIDR